MSTSSNRRLSATTVCLFALVLVACSDKKSENGGIGGTTGTGGTTNVGPGVGTGGAIGTGGATARAAGGTENLPVNTVDADPTGALREAGIIRSVAPGCRYGVSRARQPVVADFNQDGLLDVGFPGTAPPEMIAVLGNGDGSCRAGIVTSLAAAPAYSDGQVIPTTLAAGDFDADGKPDVVVGFWYAKAIQVLRGIGDGTFAAGAVYPTPKGPDAIVVGDFTGDGKPDLAIAQGMADAVSVLPGVGDGTFGTAIPTAMTVGMNPASLAAADLNKDSKLDLAVGQKNAARVTILLGAGNGAFAAPIEVGLNHTGDVSSVAIGDLNGDQILDIAVSSPAQTWVDTLLGTGDGNFTTKGNFTTATLPVAIAMGDFNADGKLDVVTANHIQDAPGQGDGSVSVLLGKGDGTLEYRNDLSTDSWPNGLAVRDFNGDGKTDLFVTSETSMAFFTGTTLSTYPK